MSQRVILSYIIWSKLSQLGGVVLEKFRHVSSVFLKSWIRPCQANYHYSHLFTLASKVEVVARIKGQLALMAVEPQQPKAC